MAALTRFVARQFATGRWAGDACHLAIARNHGAQRADTLDCLLLKAGSAVSQGIKR
ncbi:MAG: hypothetical protein ACYDDA_14735 [Acidiferrobacteraceae bacterium]